MKKILPLLLILLVTASLYYRYGPVQTAEGAASLRQETLTVTLTDGTTHAFTVEVADTPETLRDGLMFRTRLDADAGMLFVFPAEMETSFWMKNTLIPLDMLFIRADGTISKVHANAQPQDLTNIPTGGPVAAAIEISGGRAAALGITPGAHVSSPALQPKMP